jgi:hypothetical protein
VAGGIIREIPEFVRSESAGPQARDDGAQAGAAGKVWCSRLAYARVQVTVHWPSLLMKTYYIRIVN